MRQRTSASGYRFVRLVEVLPAFAVADQHMGDPSALSCNGDVSPVYAPSPSSACSAAMANGVLRAASTTAAAARVRTETILRGYRWRQGMKARTKLTASMAS